MERRARTMEMVAALAVAPVRLVSVRGTPAEATEVRSLVKERLESVRANAAVARSLATLAQDGWVREAEGRAVTAIRGADELCRATSALPPERLARRSPTAR